MTPRQTTGRRDGFTRVECVATGFGLFLVLGVAISTLGSSREPGNRAVCVNHLRQLGIASLMYSSENSGLLPPRYGTNLWPTHLNPYFQDLSVLTCPTDNPKKFRESEEVDLAPRSYLYNGWNDYWSEKGIEVGFVVSDLSVPEAEIPMPSQTLLFGEKISESHRYHVNLSQGDDVSNVDNRKHHSSPGANSLNSGGSNFAFVDGSVRFLPFGGAISPLNLWAISEKWRTNSIPIF
jgi:prepilin-type processing-associated H-X9-DG protein